MNMVKEKLAKERNMGTVEKWSKKVSDKNDRKQKESDWKAQTKNVCGDWGGAAV